MSDKGKTLVESLAVTVRELIVNHDRLSEDELKDKLIDSFTIVCTNYRDCMACPIYDNLCEYIDEVIEWKELNKSELKEILRLIRKIQ